MSSQKEKGLHFRALHQRDRAFIIPNPWDAGTARLLARMGFEALATTSAGLQDGAVGREAMLKHVAAQEMQQHGTFRFAKDLIPYKEINDMFEP
jgi:2-methylisocitrate lyase-like PEP mutase family enzyme